MIFLYLVLHLDYYIKCKDVQEAVQPEPDEDNRNLTKEDFL